MKELVVAVVLLLLVVAEAQDCTTDSLINNLGSGSSLVAASLEINSGQSNPAVSILDQSIVCLVTDNMRGLYSLVSVVVNYTCTGAACPVTSESL